MSKLIQETEELMGMMKRGFQEIFGESRGTSIFFSKLRKQLKKIYLRPNNVIDTSLYSQSKIEAALSEMGFEFRQEIEDKLHFFNNETNVSVYLNPTNRKITMTP
jgi:predicted transcriptional regulator